MNNEEEAAPENCLNYRISSMKRKTRVLSFHLLKISIDLRVEVIEREEHEQEHRGS